MSIKKFVIAQIAIIVGGILIILIISGIITSNLAEKYQKENLNYITKVISKDIGFLLNLFPDKTFIENGMRNLVAEIPALDGICLRTERNLYFYPKEELTNCFYRRSGVFKEGNEIAVCIPFYEEYASELLEKKKIGMLCAFYNREYVEQFKNAWKLNSAVVSAFLVLFGLTIFIFWRKNLLADLTRLRTFVDSIRKQEGKITNEAKENLKNLRLEEFKEIANLILNLIKQVSKLNKRLQRLAVTDPLTNLFNRNFFNLFIHKLMSDWKRRHYPLSVAILDIDNFKQINDAFGHEKGDEVLRTLGYIIKSTIRNSDFAIRYGGEEFLIIFPHTTKKEALKSLERIKERFSNTRFGIDRKVTFSAGIADYPSDVKNLTNLDILIRIADHRLYRAKGTGKNKIVIE